MKVCGKSGRIYKTDKERRESIIKSKKKYNSSDKGKAKNHEWGALYRAKNKESINAKYKKYSEENSEKIKDQRKINYRNNLEENRKKGREYSKKQYWENLEESRRYAREYARKNREKICKRARERRKTQKYKDYRHNYDKIKKRTRPNV